MRSAPVMTIDRRQAVAAMAGLSAEAAWREAVFAAEEAVAVAAEPVAAAEGDAVAAAEPPPPPPSLLPSDAIQQLQAGRAVVVPDWVSAEECAALRREDAARLYHQ